MRYINISTTELYKDFGAGIYSLQYLCLQAKVGSIDKRIAKITKKPAKGYDISLAFKMCSDLTHHLSIVSPSNILLLPYNPVERATNEIIQRFKARTKGGDDADTDKNEV